MADPVNTIVDEIPLPDGASYIQTFGESIYCAGGTIKRVDIRTKTTSVIGPEPGSACLALVDFHRPIDLPPDVAGAGAPDRRIYTGLINGRIGEIVPALFNQFTAIPVMDPSAGSFIRCIVGTNNAKYLYFHEWINYTIGIVDLGTPDPHTVGSIQLDSPADDMVVSPDDRFLYAAHRVDDAVSVIDTSTSPPSVKKVPVVNGPFALALSADGKKLFVAQAGDSAHPAGDLGTGTLSVFDTATMQGVRVFTGKGSSAVTLNDVGTRAYVSNDQDNTVSVVDVTGAPQVIDTITGFNSPGEMCLSTDQRHLYVNQFDSPTKIAVVAV